MDDEGKTRSQLLRELRVLRLRLAAYEPGVSYRGAPIPTDQIDAVTAQLLLRCAPAAIIVLDHEGRVILWSPAAEQLFGWREDEVLGHINPVVPDEAMEEYRELLQREMQGQSALNRLCQRKRKDGTMIDVRLSTALAR